MKKFLLYLVFFNIVVLYSESICAQNYQLFFSGRLYIYEYSDSVTHFTFFKSGTPQMSGTDTIFKNLPRGNDDYTYGMAPDDSIFLSDTTWAGYKFTCKQTGENILLNRFSDSVIFHPTANLNDSWTLYQFTSGDKFTAAVTAISYDSVFSTMDSVKSITIQRYDPTNSPVADSLNGFTFRLSRSYGLLNTVSIIHFPLSTRVYDLRGIDSVIGDQRISPSTMFNFDVGDVFHYSSFRHFSQSVYLYTYEKKTLLSKNVYPDSIQYTFDDSVYSIEDGLPQTYFDTLIHSLLIETHLTSILSHDSLFGILPMMKSNLFSGYNYMTTWHRSINNRRAIYTVPCVRNTSLSIPSLLYREITMCTLPECAFLAGENKFVEGLGLFHQLSDIDSHTGTRFCYSDLVFYKKGNEIYGTPIVFPNFTDINSIKGNNLPRLINNPANRNAEIINCNNFELTNIYNSELIATRANWKKENNNIIVETENLSPGMYFITLRNESVNRVLKLVVIH